MSNPKLGNSLLMTGEARNRYLVAGAAMSAAAALLHVGCIVFGASWYRFFGAGEQMAQLAAAGNSYPAVLTSGIVIVLAGWSLYAFSASSHRRKLPLMRPALCIITSIYLLRGLAVFPLVTMGLGRGTAFWWWSSAICLTIGAVHLVGLRQVWARL